MFLKRKLRSAPPVGWSEHVTSVLAREFGWTDEVCAICLKVLNSHAAAGEVSSTLEFICDSPGVANWRLKKNTFSESPWALRLSDYAQNTTPERDERRKRIDAEMNSLNA